MQTNAQSTPVNSRQYRLQGIVDRKAIYMVHAKEFQKQYAISTFTTRRCAAK